MRTLTRLLVVVGLVLAPLVLAGQVTVTPARQRLPPGSTVQAGTGTATATVGGVLTTSVTSACTIANTTETDLWTYTVPAGTLSATGKGIRVTAFGTLGATGNNKTMKIYWAGVAIFNSGAQSTNDGIWRAVAEILRTGASAQVNFTTLGFGNNTGSTQSMRGNYGTSTGDTTTALIVKMTGLNGTAAANDICFQGAIVETLF